MKKIIVAVVTALSLLISLVGSAQDMEYKSSGFSAEITSNGEIKNLKIGDKVFIRYLYLHGIYSPVEGVEKHDTRFFQFNDKSSCDISRPDPNTMVIEKKAAVLGNEKYPQGAIYNEKITLTPDRISAKYAVETTAPMAANADIFLTLCELPLSFTGCGYKFTNGDGKETMAVVPREYSASDNLRVFTQKLAFVMPGGIMTVEGDPNTVMRFFDGRNWGADHLRLDIHQKVPWNEKPVTYQPGTKFGWSFTISYVVTQK